MIIGKFWWSSENSEAENSDNNLTIRQFWQQCCCGNNHENPGNMQQSENSIVPTIGKFWQKLENPDTIFNQRSITIREKTGNTHAETLNIFSQQPDTSDIHSSSQKCHKNQKMLITIRNRKLLPTTPIEIRTFWYQHPSNQKLQQLGKKKQ